VRSNTTAAAESAPGGVEIRAASWRDFLPVHRLEKACFQKDAWPWIDVLAALTFPETVRYVAVCDERIVGFVVGDRRQRQGVGWIATIGVHPAYRGRKIGTKLLDLCEHGLNMTRVRLSLRPSNQAALHLYQRQGYREVDRWPRYYSGGEDALVMEKSMST
jgi:ribosomal protein S18 acetylase RimI-like enzyme